MGETGRVAATLQKMGIGGCGLAALLSGEGEVPIRLDHSTRVPTSEKAAGDDGIKISHRRISE